MYLTSFKQSVFRSKCYSIPSNIVLLTMKSYSYFHNYELNFNIVMIESQLLTVKIEKQWWAPSANSLISVDSHSYKHV